MPDKGSEFIVKFQDIALPKDLETKIAKRIQLVVAEELAAVGSQIPKIKEPVLQFDPIRWRGKYILKASAIPQIDLNKTVLQTEIKKI